MADEDELDQGQETLDLIARDPNKVNDHIRVCILSLITNGKELYKCSKFKRSSKPWTFPR